MDAHHLLSQNRDFRRRLYDAAAEAFGDDNKAIVISAVKYSHYIKSSVSSEMAMNISSYLSGRCL